MPILTAITPRIPMKFLNLATHDLKSSLFAVTRKTVIAIMLQPTRAAVTGATISIVQN